MQNYDSLKLQNQLCFPLYACSKEIVKRYKEDLDKINLTYTQYLVMLVLWEKDELNVKELGEYLMLDSGTLTSVLKKLEEKNYLTRERSKVDERNLIVRLTSEGETLKETALCVPQSMGKKMNLTQEEAKTLYTLLYKVLNSEE